MSNFVTFIDKNITANKVVHIDGKTYTPLTSQLQPLKKRICKHMKMRIESHEEHPPVYSSELPLHTSSEELQSAIVNEVYQCDHIYNSSYDRYREHPTDHSFISSDSLLNDIREIVREECTSIIQPLIIQYERIVTELMMHNRSTKEPVTNFEKPKYLPIKTIQAFERTEYLSTDEFGHLINYLSRLGGNSLRQQIGYMISELITTELAMKLSLSKQNKVGFNNTKLLDAIFVAMKRIKPELSCTKESLLILINRAVRCAKEKHRYHAQELYKCKRSKYTKKSN